MVNLNDLSDDELKSKYNEFIKNIEEVLDEEVYEYLYERNVAEIYKYDANVLYELFLKKQSINVTEDNIDYMTTLFEYVFIDYSQINENLKKYYYNKIFKGTDLSTISNQIYDYIKNINIVDICDEIGVCDFDDFVSNVFKIVKNKMNINENFEVFCYALEALGSDQRLEDLLESLFDEYVKIINNILNNNKEKTIDYLKNGKLKLSGHSIYDVMEIKCLSIDEIKELIMNGHEEIAEFLADDLLIQLDSKCLNKIITNQYLIRLLSNKIQNNDNKLMNYIIENVDSNILLDSLVESRYDSLIDYFLNNVVMDDELFKTILEKNSSLLTYYDQDNWGRCFVRKFLYDNPHYFEFALENGCFDFLNYLNTEILSDDIVKIIDKYADKIVKNNTIPYLKNNNIFNIFYNKCETDEDYYQLKKRCATKDQKIKCLLNGGYDLYSSSSNFFDNDKDITIEDVRIVIENDYQYSEKTIVRDEKIALLFIQNGHPEVIEQLNYLNQHIILEALKNGYIPSDERIISEIHYYVPEDMLLGLIENGMYNLVFSYLKIYSSYDLNESIINGIINSEYSNAFKEFALFNQSLFLKLLYDEKYVSVFNYPIEIKKYIEYNKKTYLILFNYIKNTSDIEKYFDENGPKKDLYDIALFDFSLFPIMFSDDQYKVTCNYSIEIENYIQIRKTHGNVINNYIKSPSDIEKYFDEKGPKKDLYDIALFDNSLFPILFSDDQYKEICNYSIGIENYIQLKKIHSNIFNNYIKNISDIEKYFDEKGPKKDLYDIALFDNSLFPILFSDDQYKEICNYSIGIENYIQLKKIHSNIFNIYIKNISDIEKYFDEKGPKKELFDIALFDFSLFAIMFSNDQYKVICNYSNDIIKYIEYNKKNYFCLNNYINNISDIKNYFDENGPKKELFDEALFDNSLFAIMFSDDQYKVTCNYSIEIENYIRIRKTHGNIFNNYIKSPSDIEKYFDEKGPKKELFDEALFDNSLFYIMFSDDYKSLYTLYYSNYPNHQKYLEFIKENNVLFIKNKEDLNDPSLIECFNNLKLIIDKYGKINVLNNNDILTFDFVKYCYPLFLDESIYLLKYYTSASNEIIQQAKNNNGDNLKRYYQFVKDYNLFENDDKTISYAFRFYSGFAELAKNVIENSSALTEKDLLNFKRIILTSNKYNISTIEELKNYSEIVKNEFNKIIAFNDIFYIKELFANIFGYVKDDNNIYKNYSAFEGLKNDFINFQLDNFQKIKFIYSEIEKNYPYLSEQLEYLKLTSFEYKLIILIREVIESDNISVLKSLLNNNKLGDDLVDYSVEVSNIKSKIRTLYNLQMNSKLTDVSKLKSKKTSNTKSIKVYKGQNDLEGSMQECTYEVIDMDSEKFNFLAHRIYHYDPKYKEFCEMLMRNPYLWDKLDGASTLSTSSISDKGFWMIHREDNSGVIYLFNQCPNSFLLYMHGRDLFVQHGGHTFEPKAQLNLFTDFEALQQMSSYYGRYNEIAGFRQGMMPCAIACVGQEPNDDQIRAASYFNVPIIRFNVNSYQQQKENQYQEAREKFKNNPSLNIINDIFLSGTNNNIEENVDYCIEILNNKQKNGEITIKEYIKYLYELSNVTSRIVDYTRNEEKVVYKIRLLIKTISLLKNISSEELIDIQFANMGESGAMFEYHQDEKSYLVKPSADKSLKKNEPFRAEIQSSASILQSIISEDTFVDVKTIGLEKMRLSIQEKINTSNNSNILKNWVIGNSTLNEKQKAQLLQEYVLDFVLCNFDCFEGNFVVDDKDNIRGIDKEQSFRFIDDISSLDPSFNYVPNGLGRVPIYKILFEKYQAGNIELDFDVFDRAIQKIESISDDDYKNIFRKYANAVDENKSEEILNKILNRKKIAILKMKEYINSIRKQRKM